MTEYHTHGLTLTENQTNEIESAVKNHASVTIRLTKDSLQGNHKLPLTRRQIMQINRAK